VDQKKVRAAKLGGVVHILWKSYENGQVVRAFSALFLWFGTERETPFYRAEIRELATVR
jgi:hypothetical protein